jgi:hypothetical protein
LRPLRPSFPTTFEAHNGNSYLRTGWRNPDRQHWCGLRLSEWSPCHDRRLDFAYVGFAVIWGIVFFSEVPDMVSTLGMALIVDAGVLSLRQ